MALYASDSRGCYASAGSATGLVRTQVRCGCTNSVFFSRTYVLSREDCFDVWLVDCGDVEMLPVDVRVPREVDKFNPTFPLFAKPYDGSLSTNLHYIKSADELTQEILNDEKLLFMEYIDKSVYKEFTVDMYFGRDNRVKCIVPRERIEIRAGEINKGRTVKNEIVPFIKDRLGFIEGCVGCICMQLFFHPETKDMVGIEINPRFGGGYPLSYMCGGNYPELLIREYFLGEDVEYFDDWKDGMLMLRFDDAVFV